MKSAGEAVMSHVGQRDLRRGRVGLVTVGGRTSVTYSLILRVGCELWTDNSPFLDNIVHNTKERSTWVPSWGSNQSASVSLLKTLTRQFGLQYFPSLGLYVLVMSPVPNRPL